MAHAKNHDYHILHPSVWPFLAAVGAFFMLFGATLWMHDHGPWMFLIGLAAVLYTMYAWFADMVFESREGDHTPVVRIGLRYGFILFIMSEVMFFAAWFWAFFKNALYPMGPMSPIQDGVWPPEGVIPFDPWHLPLINTLILLCSGAACTWAHHALAEEDNREDTKWGLILAVGLGVLFTAFQIREYAEAAFSFSGNVYGAIFFMATGFHGVHVVIGTIFLLVCLLRIRAGQMSREQHVGFEAAAWYWHFVDVVWLFLFASIYIWGS
ncbi:cytochrome c oxidase subunit 3 [Pseudoroseicyclus aestuarii]|uniref:Cytochrome c oxidase subunit 3 n=1 Tax=Pseudoroseicyclus aestuarii TaxID=1795041 RepID=A0A318T9K5_9RHOB|nr:cytochrome c oxidase subunit 3 [Pseudoroseicyclus aestuarii]PYE84998.1 cytochrome c oxidase subunit 3 [Pseudoroseicyclus aestuarii]